MNNKVAIRIALICFLLTPFSCSDLRFGCTDSCCGETFEQAFTAIESLTITTGSIEIDPEDRFERWNFTNTLSSNWETAALRVNVEDLTFLAQSIQQENRNFNFSLMSSAFACDPPEPEPTQPLSAILITSDRDLMINETAYGSGADLSEFFSVVGRLVTDGNQSIAEFIIAQNENLYLLGSIESGLILQLNQHIAMPAQTLAIRFEFEDQSVFELTTRDFTIE